MSGFCSLEEAFATAGPPPAASSGRSSKKQRIKQRDGFTSSVPAAASSVPDPDRQAQLQPPTEDVLGSGPGGAPTSSVGAVVVDGATTRLDDMFPLPGDTGDVEEWQKAFTLPGSRMPVMPAAPPGGVSVDGKSTLWRQIPVPAVSAPAPAPIGSEMMPVELTARLDALTRQLESLTTPAPLQSTAELFLFVAIGLLVLLAIDTLLRFAVRMASSVVRMSGGGRRFGGGGRRMRWY